jgi:hypothetical protein
VSIMVTRTMIPIPIPTPLNTATSKSRIMIAHFLHRESIPRT